MNHQKPKLLFTKLAAAIVVLGLAVAAFGLGPTTQASPSTSAVHVKVKTHRPVIYHQAKHVCGPPKKHFAQCMAEHTVDANGKTITGTTPASVSGYGPAEFHAAYNLPCTPGGPVAAVCAVPSSYGPQTIVIVDAGNFDTGVSGLESSLQNYDQNYGLPACTVANGCLTVVNQTGQTSPLPADAGWSQEIALDVEVAHMICQTCRIVLMEGDSATAQSLAMANDNAVTLFNPTAISNSWGATSDVTALDAYFDHPGVAIVAATGDNGTVSNGPAWPADNPNVLAVAGTELDVNTDNTRWMETVWSGSGGGCSTYYPAATWQTTRTDWATNGCGSFRAFGDVAADAMPATGAAVNQDGTWYQVGGTSLSTPLVAGIIALNGGVSPGVVGSSVPYSSAGSDFFDVASGSDCTSANTTHCAAQAGFDTPTGLGAPIGLGGFASPPGQPDLSLSSPSQSQIHLSWTAVTVGASINGYDVYRNGTKLTTVTTTTYDDTGLSPNTDYSYYIVAKDSNGKTSSPSKTVGIFTAYPADINQDSHIDLLDLSLLANKYGQSSSSLGRADINSDGQVDLLDLSLLANGYGSE